VPELLGRLRCRRFYVKERDRMSSHADDYKDMEQAAFVRHWADGDMPELTEANMRWNVAKRRAAEDDLRRLKAALRILQDAVR
jgi:hypothetical protein